jgi:hypothetical protein
MWVKTNKKPSPEFHQTITPDGSVANKFSSTPTGTEKKLPVGYKNKTVSVFRDYPVRRYIQFSGCFFPAAGDRFTSGQLRNVGCFGGYWASSPLGANAYDIDLTSGDADPANTNDRRNGFPVRCVKEFILVCYL